MTSTRHRPGRRPRRDVWWPWGIATRNGDAREGARRLLERARIDALVHPDRPNDTDRTAWG